MRTIALGLAILGGLVLGGAEARAGGFHGAGHGHGNFHGHHRNFAGFNSHHGGFNHGFGGGFGSHQGGFNHGFGGFGFDDSRWYCGRCHVYHIGRGPHR